MKKIIVWSGVLMLLPMLAIAETHKAVQKALDYQLPENTCVKPKIITTTSEVTGSAMADVGSVGLGGGGSREVSDIDSYTRKRLERKEVRWKKCVKKYKKGLLGDMDDLKASVKHGWTQTQANEILGKMKYIQQVYMTPDGVPEQIALVEAEAEAKE